MNRDNGASQFYQLQPEMEIMPCDVVLKATKTSNNLEINIITDQIKEKKQSINGKIDVTGSDATQFEIANSTIHDRPNLK